MREVEHVMRMFWLVGVMALAVGCGGDGKPSVVPAPLPQPVEMDWSRAIHVVRNADRWEAAGSEDREAAARGLARRVREANVFGREGFTFVGLEPVGDEDSPGPEVAVFDDPMSGLRFALFPGATWELGMPGPETEHPFHLSRRSAKVEPLLVAQREVTQQQWRGVGGERKGHFLGPLRPMETVSLAEVEEWCDGLDLRLPTDDEWEAFARGGDPVWDGADAAALQRLRSATAWGYIDAAGQSQETGIKRANRAGLFDTLGNVAELVKAKHVVTDTLNEFAHSMGGSWRTAEDDLHPSLLESGGVERKSYDIGFRPVLDLPR